MSEPPHLELPLAPVEHPALDYARLRREGLRLLGRLAGGRWTDFNAHDPGVTLLEQVCYAITDLAYRVSHDLPDHLAGARADAYRSLPSPATILTCHPVTPADWRKLVLDVLDVRNAWVEPQEAFAVAHYHPDARALRSGQEVHRTRPFTVRGLYAVHVVPTMPEKEQEVLAGVAECLHAHRAACEDFEISMLSAELITIRASVEIAPVDDAKAVLKEIYRRIAEYLSPGVQHRKLADLLAMGRRVDEVFEGPRLARGFLDADAPQADHRRVAVHTSDLIRVIMDATGVRAVRDISLSASGQQSENWTLDISEGKYPSLQPIPSDIVVKVGGLTVQLEQYEIDEVLEKVEVGGGFGPHEGPGEDLPPPAGRDRRVGDYRSIQHQLPALYGIGELGLPSDAPAERHAQAKQLKAYLLFFDQVLANLFAQLDHSHELFSFFGDIDRATFTQPIDDPSLGLDQVHPGSAEAPADSPDVQAEPTGEGPVPDRKSRFLNHLLARFAEDPVDISIGLPGALDAGPVPPTEKLARDKQRFLQRYAHISGARGQGVDRLADPNDERSPGLAERIHLKLGLDEDQGERFTLVEHLLLRPVPEDRHQNAPDEKPQTPLLIDLRGDDPFSLQLTFALSSDSSARSDPTSPFGRRVAQVVRDETPAHLTPHLLWLNKTAYEAFVSDYHAWCDAYRDYHGHLLRGQAVPPAVHQHFRSTRDRLVEQLGLAKPYPLRDPRVSVAERFVAPGGHATVIIEYTQPNVSYSLRDRFDGSLITRDDGSCCEASGTEGRLRLKTPSIAVQTTFKILAIINEGQPDERRAYLRQDATVRLGLDETLDAHIVDQPPLVATATEATAPRIVCYGTQVLVEISESQEGVDYELVDDAYPHSVLSVAAKVGNREAIVIESLPMTEDVDLRIRASKALDSGGVADESILLTVVLPLKVRANPAVSVATPAPVVDFRHDGQIRLGTTQPTASYQLCVSPLFDEDFLFEDFHPDDLVTMHGRHPVRVRCPEHRATWCEAAGFERRGDRRSGTGSALTLTAPSITSDYILLVRASKQHVNGPLTSDGALVESAVPLQQAAVLLVRPEPDPKLELWVRMIGSRTLGEIEVRDGQPGVYYRFAEERGPASLGLPAYIHRRDRTDPQVNKGIRQLRLGVDFAIARSPEPPDPDADLAKTPPLPPVIETAPLEADTTLSVLATRAYTRVNAPLSRQAHIAAIPQIHTSRSQAQPGSAVDVEVVESDVRDQYQLYVGGRSSGVPRAGTGGDLVLTTPELPLGAKVEVVVRRQGDAGLPVARVFHVPLTVAESS